MSMIDIRKAGISTIKKFRFSKPKLSIEHVSWRGKQILYHMSHPWLQTCHTPATCHWRSTRTVQTGRQQSYVTHFRSIVSGAVMDVSVGLFAECIENGHMPADLHGFMTMAPSENLNPSGGVGWNWRGNCQWTCKCTKGSEQNAMVLDEVIHGDIPKRFRWNILDVLRARAGKRNVARDGGNMPNVEDCKQHNGYSSESETASRGTSCSGCVSSAQLPDLFLQRLCPPMGEIASQKTSRTTTAGSWIQQ